MPKAMQMKEKLKKQTEILPSQKTIFSRQLSLLGKNNLLEFFSFSSFSLENNV